MKKSIQNGTQNETFWDLLFRESVKMEKCVWTAPACTDCILAQPLERSGRPKNRRKKGIYVRPTLFNPKISKMLKKEFQNDSKMVSLFRGWRPFGASWGTFAALSLFLTP